MHAVYLLENLVPTLEQGDTYVWVLDFTGIVSCGRGEVGEEQGVGWSGRKRKKNDANRVNVWEKKSKWISLSLYLSLSISLYLSLYLSISLSLSLSIYLSIYLSLCLSLSLSFSFSLPLSLPLSLSLFHPFSYF